MIRLAILTCVGALVAGAAGCFIEQPGMRDPNYAGTGQRRTTSDGSPLPATATVVSGDAALDPGALAAAVTGVREQLGGCFIASGQVDLVLSIDTAGQVTDVQGPGDVACLLPAVQAGTYPRPTVPTQFRVSLWVTARADAQGEGGAQTTPPIQGGTGTVTPTGAQTTSPPAAWRHDVFLVTIASIRIDPTRPDGRAWDEATGAASAPDLFVKMLRNDVEVLRTNTVADSVAPDFEESRGRSLRLGAADDIRFEIWDDDPGTPELVTRFQVRPPTPEHLAQGRWDIGPAPPMQLLSIRLAAPRSMVGTGIRWQSRAGALQVLEVALDSPAAAAGIEVGDRILTVDGQRVRGVSTSALEELFRGAEGSTMRLEVEHQGARRTVELARSTVFY